MTARARWGWLLACATFIAIRAPILLLEPRLWIEEGTVYLSYAFSHHPLRALLFVPNAQGPAGYILLTANLAAVISAHVFPLELAPLLSTLTAFLAQLAPCAVVLWGRSIWWSTPPRRLMACAVLLLTPAVRPSVWLQVITSQLFCGLVAFLLLGERLEHAGRRRRWIYRVVLVVCGLSGPYTAFLILPYYLRFRFARSREAGVHLGIVAASFLVHLACYAATLLTSPIVPDRLGYQPSLMAYPIVVLIQHLLQPFLGVEVADWLDRALVAGTNPPLLAVSSVISVGLILAAGFALYRRGSTDRLLFLFPVSFLALSAAASTFGLGLPRARYAVTSGVVAALGVLVACWQDSPAGNRRRAACQALTALGLSVGLATYWLDEQFQAPDGLSGHFGYHEGRPDWQEEVRRWRHDPEYQLKIWPYTATRGWPMALLRRDEMLTFRSNLSEDGFHLYTSERPTVGRIEIENLPSDFRIVAHARSDRPPDKVELTGFFEDSDLVRLSEPRHIWWRRSERSFLKHGTQSQFVALPGRRFSEAAYFALRARSLDGQPTLIEIDTLKIVPRIEGLLDKFLPPEQGRTAEPGG